MPKDESLPSARLFSSPPLSLFFMGLYFSCLSTSHLTFELYALFNDFVCYWDYVASVIDGWKSMEHWRNKNDERKPTYPERNLSQCHLFHYGSNMDCPGIAPGYPRLRGQWVMTAWALVFPAVFEEAILRSVFLYFTPYVLLYFQLKFIGVEYRWQDIMREGYNVSCFTAAKEIKHVIAFTKYWCLRKEINKVFSG